MPKTPSSRSIHLALFWNTLSHVPPFSLFFIFISIGTTLLKIVKYVQPTMSLTCPVWVFLSYLFIYFSHDLNPPRPVVVFIIGSLDSHIWLLPITLLSVKKEKKMSFIWMNVVLVFTFVKITYQENSNR